jgi:hypothetical protein
VLFIGIFVYLYHEGYIKETINYLSNLYLLIPLLGGAFGLYQLSDAHLQNYDGRSFVYRKVIRIIRLFALPKPIRKTYRLAVWLFCCGLILWAIGCGIGIYFNLRFDEEVPYATIGDAFFALCFLCWTAGIICLYEHAERNVVKETNSTFTILLPLWSGIAAIAFLIQGGDLKQYVSHTGLLAFILDMFFPLVDLYNLCLLITLLPSLGNEKLHIKGKPLRLIVIGYFFLCLASSSFTICHSLPKTSSYAYYNGGFTDVMFATGFTILNFGIFYATRRVKQPD